MKATKSSWLLGLVTILSLLILPIVIFVPRDQGDRDNPHKHLPQRSAHTDHTSLLEGPFPDGPSVTRACLECHPEAGEDMLRSSHWRWERDPVKVPERDEPVATGKKNLLNNFCIGIQGNWPPCTACHAGYGWEDETFDFSQVENIDCLVCHEHSGAYAKANGGFPAEGVDLVEVAKSVGRPTRSTCGGCHFKGGGGNAVKHGDLDESLAYPGPHLDVHMGRIGMDCIDCHRTSSHQIMGRAISVSLDNANQVTCLDCHSADLHEDERINDHLDAMACQTCHIPAVALKDATKTHWDWSTAGEDRGETDPHEYLKIKGSFIYEKELVPEYAWFSGTSFRYLLGDSINEEGPTPMNLPRGDIENADARIWPFKIHRARQIFDTERRTLIQPKTYGEGGYWTDFDWDQAARLGSEIAGQEYSGNFDFTETTMYWPLTHMVASGDKSLQCVDCHGESARMDWNALGYEGDPIRYGGRRTNRFIDAEGQEVAR
jgi:octaheme c-type cytochrome (tetrathionate reductase family)